MGVLPVNMTEDNPSGSDQLLILKTLLILINSNSTTTNGKELILWTNLCDMPPSNPFMDIASCASSSVSLFLTRLDYNID